jgi:hypothetical protein
MNTYSLFIVQLIDSLKLQLIARQQPIKMGCKKSAKAHKSTTPTASTSNAPTAKQPSGHQIIIPMMKIQNSWILWKVG